MRPPCDGSAIVRTRVEVVSKSWPMVEDMLSLTRAIGLGLEVATDAHEPRRILAQRQLAGIKDLRRPARSPTVTAHALIPG
jgi:hypothetical protein